MEIAGSNPATPTILAVTSPVDVERVNYWQERMRPLLTALNRHWDGQTRFLHFVLNAAQWRVTIVRQDFSGVGNTPEEATADLYGVLLREIRRLRDDALDTLTRCHLILKHDEETVKEVMVP